MSSSELDTLQKAFREAGGNWSTFVIWAKNTFTLGRSDYQRQYEPILYGWKDGTDHYWCGARDQGDVWFIDKPAKNDLHPTMKPVALVERAIRNSSKSRDIVLDPFGGSGTTLIAAERVRPARAARRARSEVRRCDRAALAKGDRRQRYSRHHRSDVSGEACLRGSRRRCGRLARAPRPSRTARRARASSSARPAMAPRTVCGCHSNFLTISSIVAPSGRLSISISLACLLSDRVPAAGLVLWSALARGLVIRLATWRHDLRLLLAAGAATHREALLA